MDKLRKYERITYVIQKTFPAITPASPAGLLVSFLSLPGGGAGLGTASHAHPDGVFYAIPYGYASPVADVYAYGDAIPYGDAISYGAANRHAFSHTCAHGHAPPGALCLAVTGL